MKFFVIFYALALFFSCCVEEENGPVCERNKVDCHGDDLVLCDSTGNWELQYHCLDYGLVCCPVDGSFNCLTSCEKEGDDGGI